jgi:hypothetical protein
MKRYNIKSIIMFFSLVLVISVIPVAVFGYSVTLDEFTGDDAQIQLDITGDGTSSITFSVNVLRPVFADIGGVWFNFNSFPTSSLNVTGAEVTDWVFSEDGVSNASTSNNNLGGAGNIYRDGWDAGVAFGSAGLGGSGQIHNTIFTISSTTAETLTLGTLFGARLQSVGDFSDNRGGSSKLVGSVNPTPAPVPEPTTIILFGAGLVGLVAARLRKKK